MECLDGILLVKKPAGISSVDVLRKLKQVIKKKIKIGHAGTLDPFASGLLIICFGRATKLVPLLMDVSKGYRVWAVFGELTDTLDVTGTLVGKQAVPESFSQLVITAPRLLGLQYRQIPPVFSALKYNGTPLYHLARRRNKDPELLKKLTEAKARWVVVYRLVMDVIDGPNVFFDCEVSKGAYIRTLADDLAKKIGLRATTKTLERTFIGPFTLRQAYDLDFFTDLALIQNAMIDTQKARWLLR